MKAFSIVCDLTLVQKPNWIDDFRRRFDTPMLPYHITLKNSTYIVHGDESAIEDELRLIATTASPLRVFFRDIFHNATSRGECIMVHTIDNQDLVLLRGLQRMIRTRFSRFGEHIKPSFSQYELNFSPHLTIARHLNSDMFDIAWRLAREENLVAECEAVISSLLLIYADASEGVENSATRQFITYSLK